MNENKSSDDLARELRVRLAREFAVLGLQVNTSEQQANSLHSEISDFDKGRKTFLQTLLAECSSHLEKGTFRKSLREIEGKYKQYIANAEIKNEKAKDDLEKLQQRAVVLKESAEEALARISGDVLLEKYGRGELFLTKDGPQRIIGRIVGLNESSDPAMGIVLGRSKKFSASVRDISWMCEKLDQQQPPLFYVDIKLMPLNEEELSRICWESEDYELLIKNIPEDQVVWQSCSIFCIDKSSYREAYLIPSGEESVNVLRVNKREYPNWNIEVFGRIVRNKDNLRALCNWNGYGDPPVELENASSECSVLFGQMEEYLSKKYPGIILEKSQPEN